MVDDFLSAAEQRAVLQCRLLGDKLSRRRYGDAHWDSVIRAFKETELVEEESLWAEGLAAAVRRAKAAVAEAVARPSASAPLLFLPPHVVDLSPRGRIDAHVDSVKFSGGFIAGLSFISARVMCLRPHAEEQPPPPRGEGPLVEVLLRPGSLYLLAGPLRYSFSHQVLGPESAPELLSDAPSCNERRLSVVLRDQPP